MIEKLSEYKITSRDGSFINVDCNTKIINTLVQKINELVDAVNELTSCVGQLGVEFTDPTTAENVLTKSLRMDKEFAEDECVRLQNELERTRKALGVAVGKLKGIKAYYDDSYADPHTFVNWHIVAQRLANDADDAIKAITALEQKDE